MKEYNETVKGMPSKRQTIYRLSREHGLSHQEIAVQLNISHETVEGQLGEAIRTLRSKFPVTKLAFVALSLTGITQVLS